MTNFIKKIAVTLTLVMIVLSSAIVFAKITHTLLVVDSLDQSKLPNSFRMTSDELPKTSQLQAEGLDRVRAVGSQQFSKAGLQAVLKRIPSKSVVIIDLRRESHGFLNDNAISWYGPQNAANSSKSPVKIKLSENRLLNKLNKSRFQWVHQILEKTDQGFVGRTSKEFVHVESAISEQKLASDLHVKYKRFYVEDFHAPEDADVVRFVNYVKHFPEDTWLYFHCRAGRGRTTTFMTMYDMMKNAKHVSFNDIVARQYALGGSDLRDLPDEDNYKYGYASNRLSFIKNFYEYAKENNDDYSTTWMQWKEKHLVKSS